MNIKHIVLIALTALALGLASVGVGAPAVASIKSSMSGDFQAEIGVPALSAGNAGAGGGGVHADVGAPAVAGRKPGAASGSGV